MSMFFIQLPICLLALVAALLPRSVVANTSYDYGIDRKTILKRQASNFYAVTGVHTGSGQDGSAPIRQEIRKLKQDNTTWTLYILGLDMLQNTNQTEMLSWYQIAGISVLEFQGTIADRPPRHSWATLPTLRWSTTRARRRGERILHTCLDPLSNVASSISRSLRTSSVWDDSTDCFTMASRCGTRSICDRCSEL